jgi:superfamily I DNA/RNA helicase
MMAGSELLDTLAQQLLTVFQSDGLVVYGGDSGPDIVAVDRQLGFILLDIDAKNDPTSNDPIIRLNRKVDDLESRIPAACEVSPHSLVLYSSYQQSLIADTGRGSARSLGWPDVEVGDWPKYLRPHPLAPEEFEALRAGLAPAVCFEVRTRRGATDHNRRERRKLQIMLDSEQMGAAQMPIEDVLLLTGPPGSGKTLVLAGRARYLAMAHPEWRVVMLCFNNALLPYLRRLVAAYPNVEVTTFAKFSYGEGHHFSLQNDADEAEKLARARRKGIRQTVDALLIDEGQDFRDAWVSFALDALYPGRGGAVIAGDDRQALYGNSPVDRALAGRRIDTLRLEQPYRSTRQILEVASIAQPEHDPLDWADAPEGEPVHLIYAGSWDEQAAAAAWEVRRLIDDEGRRPEDIAVLATKKTGTFNRLTAALGAQSVPHLIVTKENAASFDPGSPQVKVMTVNAAKGYEFDVVVLFGLDTLAEPPAPDDDPDPKHGRWGNAGLVGMTRARDLLLITWTRHNNPHIKRLRHLAGAGTRSVSSHTWPEDYK